MTGHEYQAGGWTALVTDHALALLHPAVSEDVARELWQLTAAGTRLGAWVEYLAAAGIAALPSFAMVEAHPEGLRVLVRGEVDVEQDGRVVSGRGLTTWREELLPAADLTVRAESADGGWLPVTGGIVRAAAARLVAAPQAAVAAAEDEEDVELTVARMPALAAAVGVRPVAADDVPLAPPIPAASDGAGPARTATVAFADAAAPAPADAPAGATPEAAPAAGPGSGGATAAVTAASAPAAPAAAPSGASGDASAAVTAASAPAAPAAGPPGASDDAAPASAPAAPGAGPPGASDDAAPAPAPPDSPAGTTPGSAPGPGPAVAATRAADDDATAMADPSGAALPGEEAPEDADDYDFLLWSTEQVRAHQSAHEPAADAGTAPDAGNDPVPEPAVEEAEPERREAGAPDLEATREPEPEPEDPASPFAPGAIIDSVPGRPRPAAPAGAPVDLPPPGGLAGFDDGDHDGETIATADVPVTSTPIAVEPLERPAPGVELVLSTGPRIEMDRPVLLGRAPEAARFAGTEVPRLVSVSNPERDISATHVEVRPAGGHVVVTDMNSTNGTVVHLPDQPSFRLQPGTGVPVGPGAVIELGVGVEITVERAEGAQ